MNFKKYHVSRNLCNPNLTRYEMAYNGNLINFTGGALYIIPAEPNTTYTVKVYATVDISVVRLGFYDKAVPQAGDKVNIIQQASQTMNPTITITNTNYPYLLLQISGAYIDVYGLSQVMLNSGSEALPYEPYDNSWRNIPHYIHKTASDTITTLPADIFSNDTTATVGLKGQTVQNGTPTPDNPVMPEGTGERSGNLLPSPVAATKSNNGITVRSDGAGRYYVSGTAENNAYITFDIQPFLIPKSKVIAGGNGTFSMFNTKTYRNDEVKLEFYYQGTLVDNWGLTNLNRTSTNYSAMADKITDTVGIFVKSGSTVDFQISPEFTNDGVLPSEFEPYGYKLDISSGDTTTPVYLGEVQSSRRIKKYVLNGTESEDMLKMPSSNLFYYKARNGLPLNSGACRCTHYINNQVPNVQMNNGEVKQDTTSAWGSTNSVIVFKDTSKATLGDFKTWLQQQYAAGTPVTVWCVLETPETAVVNEPLMRIGYYADILSNVSIPVTAGKDTLSVDTTVQPSEVTANYKGWHPVQSVHEKSRNLFDGEVEQGTFNPSNGREDDSDRRVRTTFSSSLLPGTYTITADGVEGVVVYAYAQSSISSFDINSSQVAWQSLPYTFNLADTRYVRFAFRKNSSNPVISISEVSNIMLNEGNTALPYEPYWK